MHPILFLCYYLLDECHSVFGIFTYYDSYTENHLLHHLEVDGGLVVIPFPPGLIQNSSLVVTPIRY